MTNENETDLTKNNIDPADGQPTDAAKVLHGANARAEHYDQPAGDETVTLTGDTIVAKHPAPAGGSQPEADTDK